MFMRVPASGDRQGVSLSAHATSIPDGLLFLANQVPILSF